jgi:hypothetical protein
MPWHGRDSEGENEITNCRELQRDIGIDPTVEAWCAAFVINQRRRPQGHRLRGGEQLPALGHARASASLPGMPASLSRQDDGRAMLGKPACDGEPNPLRRSRDEGSFACQIENSNAMAALLDAFVLSRN